MQTTMFFKVGMLLIIAGMTAMVLNSYNNRDVTDPNIVGIVTTPTTPVVPVPGPLPVPAGNGNEDFEFFDWERHTQIIELAKTLYMEERANETLMREVASVIMNRVNRSRWPDTIEGVIFQHRQFSCWDAGRYRYIDTSEEKAWNMAMRIAIEMYEGSFMVTNKADHYWAPKKIKSTAHHWRNGLVSLGMKGDHKFAIHP